MIDGFVDRTTRVRSLQKAIFTVADAIAPLVDLGRIYVEGLDQLPRDGRFLLVGNHTTAGWVEVVTIPYFVHRELGTRVRGLATRQLGDMGGLTREVLEAAGAVVGDPETGAELMRRGETVLVFPGGGRDMLKFKGEENTLLWEGRSGFARLAVAHDYPIVPVGLLGGDDVYHSVVERDGTWERKTRALAARRHQRRHPAHSRNRPHPGPPTAADVSPFRIPDRHHQAPTGQDGRLGGHRQRAHPAVPRIDSRRTADDPVDRSVSSSQPAGLGSGRAGHGIVQGRQYRIATSIAATLADMTSPRVAVIGAGLSGAACAGALRERGVDVEIFERGHGPGGRMASPTVRGRRVDIGAAYFTVKDPEFSALTDGWIDRGLAHHWTDTFDVVSPGGRDVTAGPPRFATSGGLRSLVRDLLPDDVQFGCQIDSLDGLPHDAVVLAMPDPQAARLAPDACEWVDYEPVIAVAAGWTQRWWGIADAAFVNDDADVSFIADDGARRGDGAAVLVAHSTAARARAHLDRPEDAVAPMLAAVHRALSFCEEPLWTQVHRWTFAKPAGTHGEAEFGLVDDSRPLGICGDAWCPTGAPRVESAWLSGRRLGSAIAKALLP